MDAGIPLRQAAEMSSPKNEILSTLFQSSQASRSKPNVIKIPRMFCLMDLPTEIRLKILEHLLVSDIEIISIHSTGNGPRRTSENSRFERPFVSILQTCKLINEEGTPILYGQHCFIVYLRDLYKQPLQGAIGTPTSSDAQAESTQGCAFFLRRLRWSTIAEINPIWFTSDPSNSSSRRKAFFKSTGKRLFSHHTPFSSHENEMLSLSNYISLQVFHEELRACRRDWNLLAEPSEDYMAALSDDPAT